MTVNVAWHPAGDDACALYRMLMPHLHMQGSEYVFRVVGLSLEKIAHCQVAVVQRLYSEANYKALAAFKAYGMKIVYDLDDDMWSVPSYNPAHFLFRKLLPGFAVCADMADLVTVSTEHLKVAVRKELGRKKLRVEVVENAMDFGWFHPVAQQYKKNRNGRVVAGWAGTATHEGDVKKVFELIPELLRELPELDFELVGMKRPESWKGLEERVKVREFVPVGEWPAAWSSWQWDLAIAPLETNNFNLSKSNIKALEASAIKIPCVMTKIAAYQKFAEKSSLLEKMVLAKNSGEWKEKISVLVRNEQLRKEVGEEMYRVGRENYDVEKNVTRWQDLFESIK